MGVKNSIGFSSLDIFKLEKIKCAYNDFVLINMFIDIFFRVQIAANNYTGSTSWSIKYMELSFKVINKKNKLFKDIGCNWF